MKNYCKLLLVAVLTFFGAAQDPPQVLADPGRADLKVILEVTNDNGGNNSADDFTIRITGANPSLSAFSGNSEGTQIKINAGENYKASVMSLRYTSAYSPECVSNLAEGDKGVCTIKLNDLAPIAKGQNPPNLIPNSSFESVSGSDPEGWKRGGYGNNDRVLEYPIPGVGGGSGVGIKVSAYTDGDAKWYFEQVPVTAGHSYNFSNNYICNVDSELSAEYFDLNHNHVSYGGFFQMEPTPINTWKTSGASFIIPEGVAYITVFHALKSVGELKIDNASLIEEPLPEPFDTGFVSLNFDDGLKTQYDNAKPKLDSAGMKGTFYIISHASPGFSISNPGVEIANGAEPADWDKTGNASSTFFYPSAGRNGGKSAGVSAKEINSNASWFFRPTVVLPGHMYKFSEWYKNSAEAELIGLVTKTDGTIEQAQILNENGGYISDSLILGSSAGQWKQAQVYFYAPENAKAITAFIKLRGVGELFVDDVLLGALKYMDAEDVRELETSGHEIGGHSQTHKDLTALPINEATEEVAGSKKDLEKGEISQVVSFDYPFGIYNDTIKKIVETANYTSGRTVIDGFNGKGTNRYTLLSKSVNASTTMGQIESWIDLAKADKEWLILTFHDINSNLAGNYYGTTPENLQTIINYLASRNIPVKKLSEGVLLLNDSGIPKPADTTPPIITMIGSSTIEIKAGEKFIDPGATAADNVDGDISNKIIVSGDVISSSTLPGTYHIYYDVNDLAGNHAVQKIRTVLIISVIPSVEELKINNQAYKTGKKNISVTWKTNLPATGRLLYDTISHFANDLIDNKPDYGYAHSTSENENLSLDHYAEINDLQSGATYYVRPVSDEQGKTALGDEMTVKVPSSGAGGIWIYWKKHEKEKKPEKDKPKPAKPKKNYSYHRYKHLYGLDSETVNGVCETEAELIMNFNEEIKPNNRVYDLFNQIIESYGGEVDQDMETAIIYFIQYGTQTTGRLGMGERAGVLDSYYSSYGKFPENASDWQDVIKIANGHWPQSVNNQAEERVYDIFRQIYHREPVEDNENDHAAISIIAYGLRPVSRNMESEKIAERTFRSVFKHYPASSVDWDVVRAIAYSGAKR